MISCRRQGALFAFTCFNASYKFKKFSNILAPTGPLFSG